MRPDAARRSVRAAVRDARGAIVTDFDGTLAEIVADPVSARAVRGTRVALRTLVAQGARVIVISGRPAAFLAARLGVPGVTYAGLYGAEIRTGRTTWIDPAVEGARPAVAAAVAILRRELPSLYVEDKGWSVAVHARRARRPEAALRDARAVLRAIAHDLGLGSVRPGRLVLEVGPRGAPTKGTTLARICAQERLRRVVVAGDDSGDLAMFEVARATVARSLTIWVANGEAPRALAATADLRLASPHDLVALLRDAAA